MPRHLHLLGLVALAVMAACGGSGSSTEGGGDECDAGAVACECRTDGGCDPLLTCQAGTCVACSDGKAGCGCLSNSTCDAGLACVEGLCESCPEGSDGCACLGGAACDADLECRDGFCVVLGECTEGSLDCACLAGGGCEAGLTCDAGYCRTCAGDVVGCPCEDWGCAGLVCGADELCREAWTCATHPCDGELECVEGEAGTDRVCQVPCPACDGPGEDGPDATLLNGACICRTLPGFFHPVSNVAVALPCDEDGDGWVRESAQYALTSAEPVIRENARCDLRRVGKVVFHNERGQTLELPTPLNDGRGLPLFERNRNDDPLQMAGAANPLEVPVYGAGGRRLLADEVNGFTKACAGTLADFNGNGVVDMAEWGAPLRPELNMGGGTQAAPVGYPAGMLEYFQYYTRFAYFLELHRGWYEPAPAGGPGAYHIAEKQRPIVRDDNFPIRYGVERPSDARTSDYWQSCDRGRDLWFTLGVPTVGMDYASLSAPDPVWRGMMHHSQFKCVWLNPLLYDSLQDHAQARHVQKIETLAAYYGTDPSPLVRREYLDSTPNKCRAVAGSRATGPDAGVKNPREPLIECSAIEEYGDAQYEEVLWTAIRINDDATRYDRGCMLQCGGFPRICPGSDPASPEARECFYMCADAAASDGGALASPVEGGFSVRGEVPVPALGDGELSGGGFTIRPEPLP